MSIINPADVILCGMPSERARLTAALPRNVVLSGQDKLSLDTLVPPSCNRVISMGLCGGLAPPLVVPCVALATTVTDGKVMWACDRKWAFAVQDLASSLNPDASAADPLPHGWMVGLDAVPWYSSGVLDLADTVPQRATLHASSGANAIDDETYYAAVLCARRGIRLNVARPLSDDYSETLPLAARGAIMSADGSANIEYLMQQLGSEPALQTLDLFRVLSDYLSSLDALGALAGALAS